MIGRCEFGIHCRVRFEETNNQRTVCMKDTRVGLSCLVDPGYYRYLERLSDGG